MRKKHNIIEQQTQKNKQQQINEQEKKQKQERIKELEYDIINKQKQYIDAKKIMDNNPESLLHVTALKIKKKQLNTLTNELETLKKELNTE